MGIRSPCPSLCATASGPHTNLVQEHPHFTDGQDRGPLGRSWKSRSRGQPGCQAPAGSRTGSPFLPDAGPDGKAVRLPAPQEGDSCAGNCVPDLLCPEPLIAGCWPARRTGWLLQTWRSVLFFGVLFFSTVVKTSLLLPAGLGQPLLATGIRAEPWKL